jgi:hypothetical protein
MAAFIGGRGVSDRARELAERNATLRLRSAVQRRAVASEVRAVQQRLASVDRAVILARGTVLHPVAVTLGVVALLVIGRTRGAGTLRLISRGLLLFAAARRLLRLVKKL